ncbi:NtaA/DmoA family FMN-dependent monooxygenase [Nocardia sp. NPDC058176]|uniref:NtaA/DmoA family FMN-dependent monooxygenase n=1 Tax=Nocardia sp. NPDC058176 TaxID=3346368 RepID=UPI0036D9B3AC
MTPSHGRRLTLAAAIQGTGTAAQSWKWPGTKWNRWNEFDYYRESAEIARSGVLDAIFVSDHPALSRDPSRAPTHLFDPTVLFSAIAAAVPDIGFVLTASSTYNSPYNLARRIGSLDAISGGRVIWNAVSNFNPDIAANYGAEPLPPREVRYRRADEFVEVVKKLWLSWDAPEGEVPDGPLWDETTARPIHHHGEFFDVTGPLNVPIGPQGHPVISQAGASPAGIDFAGKHAEIVYANLHTKESAFGYLRDLDDAAERHGRARDRIRLFPGLTVILGDTEAEALRRHEELEGVRDEDELVAAFLGKRSVRHRIPAGHDPDKPLRAEWFAPQEDQAWPIGHSKAIYELVDGAEITLRQLVRRSGPGGGHRVFVGTPRQVADHILDWWGAGAVSGFNIHLPVLNGDLRRFVDQVVPILQAEGAYPTRYEQATIRERFGLPDPRETLGATAVPVEIGQ